MSVRESLDAELEALSARDPGLAGSSLAAMLRVLADGLDSPRASLTSKAMAAARFEDGWARMRELAPPLVVRDRIDDLGAARAKRRAAAGVSSASG